MVSLIHNLPEDIQNKIFTYYRSPLATTINNIRSICICIKYVKKEKNIIFISNFSDGYCNLNNLLENFFVNPKSPVIKLWIKYLQIL